MFDLYDSEENLKINIKTGNITSNLINNGNLDSKKKAKIGEVKKAVKRKFLSELVNPNAKRRKNKGAKFISDEGDEEEEIDDK